jgi:hypothetical protein
MNFNKKLKTPVALIIFNRPDTTRIVFNEIAKAMPQQLLIIADGPRKKKSGEWEKCRETRAIVEQVNWECDVIRDYSDINLGCRNRLSSGLDWVFEQVEEAIILEDDCVPHPTFFQFCSELLERYRYDDRVSQIGGSNFLFHQFPMKDSYYFSSFQFVWGWATWKRAWKHYDVNMRKWPEYRNSRGREPLFGSNKLAKFYGSIFQKVYQGKIDTWDYQWFFANLIRRSVSIIPGQNLISNIGFGTGATHTKHTHPLENIQRQALTFPLNHPDRIQTSLEYDRHVFDKYINISKLKRILPKIKSMT